MFSHQKAEQLQFLFLLTKVKSSDLLHHAFSKAGTLKPQYFFLVRKIRKKIFTLRLYSLKNTTDTGK